MPIPSKHPIDWYILARAVEFYKARGYTYLEVPWIVSSGTTSMTLPEHGRAYGGINIRGLRHDVVGSAEQGFLELFYRGEKGGLPRKTLLCSVSPCFRDERVVDDLHQKHFMKVELGEFMSDKFNSDPRPRIDTMLKMVSDAQDFMSQYMPVRAEEVSPMSDYGETQIDLVTKEGIEVGSYGIRRAGDNTFWVYGTGVAEPRFSYLLRR